MAAHRMQGISLPAGVRAPWPRPVTVGWERGVRAAPPRVPKPLQSE